MPRRPRIAAPGYVHDLLNRAVGRATLSHKDGEYTAFERVPRTAKDKLLLRILAYCLMPNHFHLVLRTDFDGELSDFLHGLTLTHTLLWHAYYLSGGTGPLYQFASKSLPVQKDDHLFTVCLSVKCNPLRFTLVSWAEK
jgi:putative transposase